MTLLLADAYVHTIDPFAIRLTADFGVRWYGLSYAAGFVVAWLFIWWMARTGRSQLQPKAVGDLMFYGIIGVLVGGRIGYVFFYDPSLLIDFSTRFPWWGVLAINRGGMASHGGMLGVLAAVLLFARRYHVSALHVLDLGAIACTPGLFFGRFANFINGELLGRPVADQQSPPWWSMKFPQEMRMWDAQRLADVRPIVEHAGIERSQWDQALAQIMAQPEQPPRQAIDLVFITIERLIDAAQRSNEVVIEHLREILTALYPSQLMQAATDGPILVAILAIVWLRPRKPGVIGGTFLIAYGILRIITEFFRTPDAPGILGLTRAQTLSGLMVLGGIALIWWASRRAGPPLGGLWRKQGPLAA